MLGAAIGFPFAMADVGEWGRGQLVEKVAMLQDFARHADLGRDAGRLRGRAALPFQEYFVRRRARGVRRHARRGVAAARGYSKYSVSAWPFASISAAMFDPRPEISTATRLRDFTSITSPVDGYA